MIASSIRPLCERDAEVVAMPRDVGTQADLLAEQVDFQVRLLQCLQGVRQSVSQVGTKSMRRREITRGFAPLRRRHRGERDAQLIADPQVVGMTELRRSENANRIGGFLGLEEQDAQKKRRMTIERLGLDVASETFDAAQVVLQEHRAETVADRIGIDRLRDFNQITPTAVFSLATLERPFVEGRGRFEPRRRRAFSESADDRGTPETIDVEAVLKERGAIIVFDVDRIVLVSFGVANLSERVDQEAIAFGVVGPERGCGAFLADPSRRRRDATSGRGLDLAERQSFGVLDGGQGERPTGKIFDVAASRVLPNRRPRPGRFGRLRCCVGCDRHAGGR